MIEHPHVELRDGVPYIEGTKVPAQRIYNWHRRETLMDTLFKRYPTIPRSHLLNAVAFFYDNPDMVREEQT